jgi:hypothetical protein
VRIKSITVEVDGRELVIPWEVVEALKGKIPEIVPMPYPYPVVIPSPWNPLPWIPVWSGTELTTGLPIPPSPLRIVS